MGGKNATANLREHYEMNYDCWNCQHTCTTSDKTLEMRKKKKKTCNGPQEVSLSS